MIRGAIARFLTVAICLVRLAYARDVNPALLSSWYPGTGGATMDVAVSGNFVFTCNGSNGLVILDASNPRSLLALGTNNTPGFATGISVSGDLALIADGASGLEVVDVSDRTAPKIIGHYDIPGNCAGVATVGHLAYLADGDFGLEIVDFVDPTQPTLVGSYDTPGTAWAVAVSGNYAYVADGTNGLVVIDVSDPANPQKAGGYDQIPVSQIVLAGTHAYAVSDGHLITFDILNPFDPQIVSSLVSPGNISSVTVAGTTGYVTSEAGFHVVDFSNPINPKLIATSNSSTGAVRIAASGRLAFAANEASGLRIFSIANPAALDLVGSIEIPGNIRDIAVLSNYVCVLDGQAFRIVDATEPANMRMTGSYTGFPSATRIAVSGHAAFLMGGSLIEGIDLTDVTNPVKKMSIPYGSTDMKLIGTNLYFTGGAGPFTIYNFTDTGDFSLAKKFKIDLGPTVLGFQPRRCAVSRTNVFIYGLKAFTGSGVAHDLLWYDSAGAMLQDTLQAPPATEMDASDDYLFTVEGPLKVRRIDTLEVTASLNTQGAKRLAVSSNLVYLAKGRFGVEVARAGGTNIYSLGGAGTLDATAIAVGITNVFVGAGTNGLFALTKFHPLVQLDTELGTNGAFRLKIFGAINSFGTIQKSEDLQTFGDWQSLYVNTNPHIVEDTNSTTAYYRFISP